MRLPGARLPDDLIIKLNILTDIDQTMITCPSCRTPNEESEMFCRLCGAALFKMPQPRPSALGADTIKWPESSLSKGTHPALETPPVLHLRIGGEREMEVALDKAVHLGRLDPANGIFPEIDLHREGEGKGVSRHHARIVVRGENVVVEDLGSVNGTFINGVRLVPYLFETLRHGDILQLGKLVIEVQIRRL